MSIERRVAGRVNEASERRERARRANEARTRQLDEYQRRMKRHIKKDKNQSELITLCTYTPSKRFKAFFNSI